MDAFIDFLIDNIIIPDLKKKKKEQLKANDKKEVDGHDGCVLQKSSN